MNQEALINAMTQKGHTRETALGAIAGRGIEPLWREYMGGSSGGGNVPSLDFTPSKSPLDSISKAFGDLNTAYSDHVKNQTPLTDLFANYNREFMVPDLQRGLATGLEQFDMLSNQIRGVPKSIKEGAQESILTQGQLDRMTQARQAPLLEQQGILGQNLSRLSSSLGTAQSNVAQMMSVEQAERARQDMPWLRRFDTAEIIAASAMTGWNTENALTLNALLAKYNAGVQMSENEKSRMHELAMSENEFQRQLDIGLGDLGAFNFLFG